MKKIQNLDKFSDIIKIMLKEKFDDNTFNSEIIIAVIVANRKFKG
ncbi:hypothetical protein OCHUTO_1021 [Orientia chuto str. Dubai]|uniref:Uncharacterized protein n=1 Tax=Orientia chuto str. Dubai TaxID=1359168 RepID=A0A0F3MGX4_9RICK|nr:hypothetical protein [Candidatus Orientia mediorientalis]KJV55010.1 hypothetical protein OCHUTO_1021 [Orientia chuto str. Dubai]